MCARRPSNAARSACPRWLRLHRLTAFWRAGIRHGTSSGPTRRRPAQATSGWYLNTAGTGWSDASFVSSLNVAGAGFIQQKFSLAALGFNFTESGAYQVLNNTGSAPFGWPPSSRRIAATFSSAAFSRASQCAFSFAPRS